MKKKLDLLSPFRHKDNVDAVNEDRTPNLKFFFKQFSRKFGKIITLNLMMLMQVLPIIIAVLVYYTGPQTPTQKYSTYSVLYGMQTAAPNPVSQVLLTLNMVQFGLPTYNTYVYWVIIPLAVILVITYGWQNVGATYVLRGLVRGDGVFIWSDYFYAIKKNIKQGLLLGIIDCAVIFLLTYDLIYFMNSPVSTFTNIMYGLIIAIIILYLFIRMYTYLQLVTFNISIFKLIKNSLIFTVVGIKRNLMAALGTILITGITVFLIVLLVPLGIGIPIILPALYFLGFIGFITVYAAYPVIDRYMIKPVKKKAADPDDPQ